MTGSFLYIYFISSATPCLWRARFHARSILSINSHLKVYVAIFQNRRRNFGVNKVPVVDLIIIIIFFAKIANSLDT